MKKQKKTFHRSNPKRSNSARAVAHEVIERVRKGKKVSVRAIAIRRGYSPSSASSNKVQNTKSYQEVIQPVIAQMERERQRAIDLMPKASKKAKYRDLVDATDKLTKNIQLLHGRSTSNVAISMRNYTDAELERIATGGESGASQA